MGKEKSPIHYCPQCGIPKIGRLYSLKTVAELTDTHAGSWRRRIQDREISYVKIGKSVRISAEALSDYMKRVPSLTEEAESILIDQ